jgi:hypothetical protein
MTVTAALFGLVVVPFLALRIYLFGL